MQAGAVHGMQAGLLDEDDPVPAHRLQESAVHGHSLRTTGRLQTGPGYGLLPHASLQCWCRMLRQWRLQQLLRLVSPTASDTSATK